jgi:hypothetical protein
MKRNYRGQDLSNKIRERAYELWVESGYRNGDAEQNWLAAEREILAASLGPTTPALPSAGKARRIVASKRAKLVTN